VRLLDGKIADRSEEITDELWETVNKFNRDMVQDYLDNQADLSAKTRPAYRSGLRVFFVWVKDNLKDKDFTQIKKKEFQKYLNWLTNRGLSDSAIRFKKSCVSTFCNYVMMMYEEDYPTFRNFTVGLKVVQTGYVHEKVPLTPDEYLNLCQELERREEWQKLAYLVFSYSTGCRRAEARQLLKEVVDYPAKEKAIKIVDENGKETSAISKQYLTHTIRCKGKSVVGKPRRLKFGEDAMSWLKKWLEIRGEDDCPFMFVVKTKDGNTRQVGEGIFNDWCSGLFTEIVKRRCHPHLFRESRATNLVVYEHKSAEVAQKLLGHDDVSTTKNHYIIKNDADDESDEAFV
jgi:site-specific recombinase XerD